MADPQPAACWALEAQWEEEEALSTSLSPAFFVASKQLSALQSPVPDGSPSFPSLPVASQVRAVVAAASSLPSLASASFPTSSSSGRSVGCVGPQRVRVAHREIDARRRRKEGGCIRQLQELLGLAPVEARLSVLQACVERIERLEAAVQDLTAAGRESEQRLQLLAAHLQQLTSMMTVSAQTPQPAEAEESSTAVSLSPSSSSSSSFFPLSAGAVEYVRYLEEQRSLQATSFSSAGLCMMLFECQTLRLVDANSTFFATSGWTPAEILHRRCCLPASELLDGLALGGTEHEGGSGYFLQSEESDESDRPLLRQRKEDGSTALVPVPYMRQYPSALRLLREMMEGRLTSYSSRWRSVWADSRAYETDMMASVARSDAVDEPDGRRWQRPTHALVVASPDSAVRLDIPVF